MNKLYCFNRWAFENYCKEHGWDSDHIPENSAFISICGTHPVQEFVLQEGEYHYLDKGDSVLNLDFDDINEAIVPIESTDSVAKGLDPLQAELAVRFIKDNLGKDFYIHCRAGHSRSQAFVRYILDMYDTLYDFQIRPENPPTNYNQYVKTKLLDAARFLGEDIRIGMVREGYEVEYIQSSLSAGIIPGWVLKIKLKRLAAEIIKQHDGQWIVPSYGIAKDDYELWEILSKVMKP